MSEEITYEKALDHFQKQGPFWDALCNGILAKRETYIADLKRNAQTPNCKGEADAKAIGGMIAVDDLYYDFKLPVNLPDED